MLNIYNTLFAEEVQYLDKIQQKHFTVHPCIATKSSYIANLSSSYRPRQSYRYLVNPIAAKSAQSLLKN